jgi:hypothetical protein
MFCEAVRNMIICGTLLSVLAPLADGKVVPENGAWHGPASRNETGRRESH